MGYEFDAAVAVTRAGAGAYTAELDGGWLVGAALNGGYLLSVIGTAIRAELEGSGHVDPFTISAYYLSASVPGPAQVRVEVRRAGRGTTTVAATLSQDVDGAVQDRITVLATYGDLARTGDDVRTTATPPELPPAEECLLTSDAPPDFKEFVPLVNRFAMRLDPATAGWAFGKPGGHNYLQGWFAFADERPVDTIALLTVVDALPPVTLELGMPGWAPTLELTAHVRCAPAPGLLRVRHETRNFAGGFFEEDCEVWDSAGRLVAQSRQLALQPRG